MELDAGWLAASLLVSTLGFALFRYGKAQARAPQLATGVALMVYPCFVASATWMLVLGGALVLSLWLAVRAGL